MADVYRAWDTHLGRDVALKMLKPDLELSADARARFLREARLACRCSHKNIVVTYDAGEIDGRLFLALEWLDGQTLRSMMQAGGAGLKDVLSIAIQVTEALEYVHSLGIIHRDVKPSNIWIERSGQIKLIDFGIARTPDWECTSANLAIGTPAYMAPEQLDGTPGQLTTAVDIYGFGVVLFEMLTRRLPIRAADSVELYQKIRSNALDLTPLETAPISPMLAHLIRRCVAKDPHNRWPDFAAIREVLRRVDGGALKEADNRGHRILRFAAPALLAVLLAGVFARFALIGRRPVEQRPAQAPVRAVENAHPSLPRLIKAKGGDMVLVEPPHSRPFYIDRTEVSVASYAEFCVDARREQPAAGDKRSDLPAVNVNYEDAAAFAAWAGKRLPTRSEWTEAARGGPGAPLPWGTETNLRLANVRASRTDRRTVTPVDSYPDGASACGAINMVGNVWEWTSESRPPREDEFRSYARMLRHMKPPLAKGEAFHEIRGGAFTVFQPFSEWSDFVTDAPVFPSRVGRPDIGLRCVRDAK
jgi:hypothetical protein